MGLRYQNHQPRVDGLRIHSIELMRDQKKFMSINATLMYASKRTYPEISFPVVYLACRRHEAWYGRLQALDGERAELRVKLDTQVKLYALNLSDSLQIF